jgi:hypothetical protein
MPKTKPVLHLVPDPGDSALLICAGTSVEPGAVPVIPTFRANSFWSRLARLSLGSADDE